MVSWPAVFSGSESVAHGSADSLALATSAGSAAVGPSDSSSGAQALRRAMRGRRAATARVRRRHRGLQRRTSVRRDGRLPAFGRTMRRGHVASVTLIARRDAGALASVAALDPWSTALLRRAARRHPSTRRDHPAGDRDPTTDRLARRRRPSRARAARVRGRPGDRARRSTWPAGSARGWRPDAAFREAAAYVATELAAAGVRRAPAVVPRAGRRLLGRAGRGRPVAQRGRDTRRLRPGRAVPAGRRAPRHDRGRTRRGGQRVRASPCCWSSAGCWRGERPGRAGRVRRRGAGRARRPAPLRLEALRRRDDRRGAPQPARRWSPWTGSASAAAVPLVVVLGATPRRPRRAGRGRRTAARSRRSSASNTTSDHESFVVAGLPAARIGGTDYAAYHSAADLPPVVRPGSAATGSAGCSARGSEAAELPEPVEDPGRVLPRRPPGARSRSPIRYGTKSAAISRLAPERRLQHQPLHASPADEVHVEDEVAERVHDQRVADHATRPAPSAGDRRRPGRPRLAPAGARPDAWTGHGWFVYWSPQCGSTVTTSTRRASRRTSPRNRSSSAWSSGPVRGGMLIDTAPGCPGAASGVSPIALKPEEPEA